MGVTRRKALYGVPANDTNTCDAIGRAYVAGLLSGSPDRALELMNAGRKIAGQYWIAYGMATHDSLARFQPQDAKAPISDKQREDNDRIREQALNDALGMVTARGRDVRRAFDYLVIDWFPDSGPDFLDRIVYAHRQKARASERDYAMLALAIEGLEVLA
jgi:hypothetical protein